MLTQRLGISLDFEPYYPFIYQIINLLVFQYFINKLWKVFISYFDPVCRHGSSEALWPSQV